jgi:hypothetical protein
VSPPAAASDPAVQEADVKLFRGAVRTGIAVKAFDIARREMRKPENQRKARELMAKAQQEFRKPENQRKAKDLLGKVTKRGGTRPPA